MGQTALRTHPSPEVFPLLNGQAVALGDDGNDVDDLAELLHDDDIEGPKGVAGRVDEEESAVDAGVDNVLVAHGGELFAEVGRVLVLKNDKPLPKKERKKEKEEKKRRQIAIP